MFEIFQKYVLKKPWPNFFRLRLNAGHISPKASGKINIVSLKYLVKLN